MTSRPRRRDQDKERQGWAHARRIIRAVYALCAEADWVHVLQQNSHDEGLTTAIANRDSGAIFDWLMWILSHQGVSDAAADSFMAEHGNIRWSEIADALKRNPSCEKLDGYWGFTGCRYQKSAATCSQPLLFAQCPLPGHVLRNGRLNQTAYSLFLFIRDVAGGDIVSWIDDELSAKLASKNMAAARAALVDPLRNVYGLSDKIIGLALASLLIGAGQDRPRWFEVGVSFIVIDTLIHNFLTRTGILKRLGATHLYGPSCYAPGACADIVATAAKSVDARRINKVFPKVFPRLVQHALWRYCSEGGLNICNGNQIDDQRRCRNVNCALYSRCDRIALYPGKTVAT